MDSYRDKSEGPSSTLSNEEDSYIALRRKSHFRFARVITSDSEEDGDSVAAANVICSEDDENIESGADEEKEHVSDTSEQHDGEIIDECENEDPNDTGEWKSDDEPDEISFIHELLVEDQFNSTSVEDIERRLSLRLSAINGAPKPNASVSPVLEDSGTSARPSYRISGAANISTQLIDETVDEDDSEQIIISDSDNDDDGYFSKQPTLQQIPKKEIKSPAPPGKEQVSRLEFVNMNQKLSELYTENRRLQQALKTIDLSQLPDKGKALNQKQANLELAIKEQELTLRNVEVKNEAQQPTTWNSIQAGATEVQPRTFGKQAMQTYNNEKALTLDRLHMLHSSLKTCPTADTLADDPPGLTVNLMPHQKHGLAWLLWREEQKPAGGILADDMGLGKTLLMISLTSTVKQLRQMNNESESDDDDENENEEEQRIYKYRGGTLVVCPASLIGQWVNEVNDKLKGKQLSTETYHGPKREMKAKRLSKFDMVVTTYAICQSEGESDTPLYRIKWDRVILDEAHQIRNHKSKTSIAVFRLAAKRRWALTGTPVHNKEMDLFALLKFLRCSPFDDLAVFKRWISQKNSGGNERLHTVLSSLLLRRTKEQLKEMKQLTCLPEREWELIEIKMDKDEMEVYQKILLFSKTLFAQYLHQRAEKNTDLMMMSSGPKLSNPSNEYFKMHQKLARMNKIKDVKQSDILVLLLRLRQVCCHPSLITAMLDNVADLGDDADGADISIDLLDQLNQLNINDVDEGQGIEGISNSAGVGLAEASRGLLNPSNPIFDHARQSTKLRAVFELLGGKILPQNDKVIIVSQWTSLLNLLVPHLDRLNVNYCKLDGSVPVKNRGAIVANFNNPKTDVQVMLLSLTAGGVGLNLVGANHLVFLDLHWNPQLEMQAQDRIYRVGQRKKVYIYKFMALETIEQSIKALQDRKKEIATNLLNGARMPTAKLSLDDLKMIFDM